MVRFSDPSVKYTERDWDVAHEFNKLSSEVVRSSKEPIAIWHDKGENKDLSTRALASLERAYIDSDLFDPLGVTDSSVFIENAQLKARELYDSQFPGLNIIQKGKIQSVLGSDLSRFEHKHRRGTDQLIQHGRALVFIDMDDFKLINDQFGHAMGDAALESFCEAAREVLREGDIIARTGQGDEFIFWLSADVAERLSGALVDKRSNGIVHPGVMQQIRKRMNELYQQKTKSDNQFNFSYGIAARRLEYGDNASEILDLMMHEADLLMLQNKTTKKVGR